MSEHPSGIGRADETPDSGADATAVLSSLSTLGPFFAVDPAPGRSTGWEPMAGLVDRSGALAAWVDVIRVKLAEMAGAPKTQVEWRVAASVAHLGLTARVLAPALAVTVIVGRPLRCDPDLLLWRPSTAGTGPVDLAVPAPRLGAGTVLVPGFRSDVVDRFAEPLVDAAHALGVSRRVLRGNVASAAAGAAQIIAQQDAVLGARARGLVARLCRDGVLDGDYESGGSFRRRSCCLVYRLATAPTFCGDCVLSASDTGRGPGSRRRSASGAKTRPMVPHKMS